MGLLNKRNNKNTSKMEMLDDTTMDMDMDMNMDMDMDMDKDMMDYDYDKDMMDYDMDDDMMRGGKGMRMGGGHAIMAMLLMETIGSSLMTFRWTKDYSSYNGGATNYWEMANMVCNYGNLVSSGS